MNLDRLLLDEPPMTVDLDAVVAAGRRIRRRNRLGYAAGAVAASVAVAGAFVTLRPADPRPETPLAIAPLTSSSPGTELTARQRAIADAIVAASPDGWTFDFGADRWSSEGLEGTVDDGAGPGRLVLGLSAGTLLRRPCLDAEHREGASCEERTLPGGSMVSIRGAAGGDGILTVVVTLTHPDGSGIVAASGNFTLTWPLPRAITAGDKRNLVHVTRPRPAYTPEQLAEVVLAVDRATRS